MRDADGHRAIGLLFYPFVRFGVFEIRWCRHLLTPEKRRHGGRGGRRGKAIKICFYFNKAL
jgi:hypothetical protein